MKTYTIYSRRMAYRLRLAGFHIVKTIPNPEFPERDFYLFIDTPQFREKFNQLLQELQKEE
nr:MAG TPA: hypothetical protein [Caudoviricetes sp.]